MEPFRVTDAGHGRLTRPPMHVEPYRNCQNCGRTLETTTHYLRHAYCRDCTGVMAAR